MSKPATDKAYEIMMSAFAELQRRMAEKKQCEMVVRIPLSPEGTVGHATLSIEKIKL
jgi:hypothetical protein